MNNLNETSSGGVGSFLAFNLVYAYFLYLKRLYKGIFLYLLLIKNFLIFIEKSKIEIDFNNLGINENPKIDENIPLESNFLFYIRTFY